MKKYVRLSIFLALAIFCVISLSLYFSSKEVYAWFSIELRLSRMISIISVNLVFLSLMFLIDSKIYKRLFQMVIMFSLCLWGYVHSLQFFNTEPLPTTFWNFVDTIFFMAWSFLAPGLVFYIIHYIKKSSEKYEDAKIGEYHVHEGFAGVILLILALFTSILIPYLIEFEILLKELSFIIAGLRIFLFLFIYCGSFLIFRDIDDVLHLKLLEKKEKIVRPNTEGSIFSKLTEEDRHFFQIPKLLLFPFGVILTSFTIDLIVYGVGFIPIDYSLIGLLGYICCFLSGGLIGIDWLRLFRFFYPETYKEISEALDNLSNLKNQEE